MRGQQKNRTKSFSRKRLLYTVLIVAILFSALYSASYFFQVRQSASSPPTPAPVWSKPKAAIVDHLSLSQPNQTFVEAANSTLQAAGFEVKYYKGEEVTVGFYQMLSTLNYDLIILRVHSAVRTDKQPYYVSFFTSEPYTQNKYVNEQKTDQLLMGQLEENGPTFFAITPKFVDNTMGGRFSNTTIIMMGCDGLKYNNMADALIRKGAKVYISWNGTVTAAYSDATTSHLLRALLIEKQQIESAIANIEPDLASGSQLLFYPIEAQNYIVRKE